jgi:plastocyanin
VTLRKFAAPAAIVAAGAAFLVSGSADAAPAKKVDIGSNFFAPGKVTVKAGDKVRFRWEGGGFEVHDVNVRKGPQRFRSPLQAGGTWATKRLRRAGTYRLFCSQHEEMTMSLVVKRR